MSRASLVVLFLVVGCDLPGKPDPAKKFVDPSSVVDFATLYGKNCAGCHGKNGTLGPAPPLSDPVFLAIIPDEELTHVIARGRKGTSMPAFAKDHGGTLTTEQVSALAAGLRKSWGKEIDGAKWPKYLVSMETKGDAKRGEAVYAKACSQCHGADGKGGDEAGALNDATFLSLSSEQGLRRIVITGRADLGMPSCVDNELSPSEVNDVMALVMSWKK